MVRSMAYVYKIKSKKNHMMLLFLLIRFTRPNSPIYRRIGVCYMKDLPYKLNYF
jgi:hypothetical protein